MMPLFSVILAGGGGTRFWPLSRARMPKQLLALGGGESLINETVRRTSPLIPPENTYVVTGQHQLAPLLSGLYPGIPRENILAEPFGRNTAPCILLAALKIHEKHGPSVLCVLPSDHAISDSTAFLRALSRAADLAGAEDTLVTLGISPTHPATGYGYIVSGAPYGKDAFMVARFVEKPCREEAQLMLEEGGVSWNSGMFVFQTGAIIAAFERFLPRMHARMRQLSGHFDDPDFADRLAGVYEEIDPVSIDYGIMERADKVAVIPAAFGWNDVGSWDALYALVPPDENENVVLGQAAALHSRGCVLYGKEKLIAAIGLEDMVVVDTPDVVMVCPKSRAQDVKLMVEHLKAGGREDLL